MDLSSANILDCAGERPQQASGSGVDLDESTLSLLLWAVAGQLKPPEGWFRATGFSEERLLQLAKDGAAAMARLRVLLAIGRLIRDEDLSVLLKARLAERLLSAGGIKELGEAARLIEKGGASPQAPAAGGGLEPGAAADEEFAEVDLDAAIAEVRRLLSELERLPTPEELAAATEAALETGVLDDVAGPLGDAE